MSEQLTFNQINEQLPDDLPTVLVPGEDGSISIGKLSLATKSAYIRGEKGHTAVKLSKETLSDQGQEKLAAEFGGLALRSVDASVEALPTTTDEKIEQLSAELDTIASPYDEETRLQLWSYASGELNRVEYALEGDSGSAEGERQKAGQALTALRMKGLVEEADKYLAVMRRLTRLRHESN